MALEDLRDRLKDQLAEVWSNIQESSVYNTARERFESQTPVVQKAILVGGSILAVLLVLYIPWSFVSTSSESVAQFDENRSLIVGMLRASRLSKESSPLPPPMDPGLLKSKVEQALRLSKIVPEQVGAMTPIPSDVASTMAPAEVQASALAVQIKQLNVTQIISVGNAIQNMEAGFKLIGMDVVQTAGQTHYYDVILKVAHFGLPMAIESVAPERPGKDEGRKRPSKAEADE